jgi:hypothetical protein
MRKETKHTFKVMLANALVALMIVLSVMVVPPTVAKAASNPALTKTSRNILVGKKYDLNIKNKVKLSSYVWTTSNKKIATVTKSGVVTGVNKGTATITCKVTTPKKTLALTCKVTIIEAAKRVKITNKVSELTVGQTYDLNRMLIPSTSNDKTTWTSSDTTIAAPDSKGKFTALKAGTVTITGTTVGGAKDSVTITVLEKEAIAKDQKELEALLGTDVAQIRIKTDEVVKFIIPKGDYSKQKLVVDAPKSDVTNNGVFASIEIKSIASDTWIEKATGNVIDIHALIARIIVESGASTSINMRLDGTKLAIENNGVVTELVMDSKSAVNITGSSTQAIPITANTAGVTITTNVPLALTCTAKVNLVLLAGSESTTVQANTRDNIPAISGTATIKVTVGTGTDAKEETVVATPIPAPIGGGGTGGGSNNPTPVPDVTYTNNSDGSTTYTLRKSYKELDSIIVRYAGVGGYVFESSMLDKLTNYLENDETTVNTWKAIDTKGTLKEFSGQSVLVTGTPGSLTKTVTFTSGILNNKAYEVTVDTTNNSVIVDTGNNVYTITKVNDKTLKISGAPDGVTFEPKFN